jgi:hypothetical protein
MALILLALWVAGVSFYLFVFVHFVFDEKRNRISSGSRKAVIPPERTVPKAQLAELAGPKKGEDLHVEIRVVP